MMFEYQVLMADGACCRSKVGCAWMFGEAIGVGFVSHEVVCELYAGEGGAK